MTDHTDRLADDNDLLEVISAFVDGEPVDRDHLRHALATENGREYLIDVLTLREAMNDTQVRAPLAETRRTLSMAIRGGAAAAVLLLALAGGYFAGQRDRDDAATVRQARDTGSGLLVTTAPPSAPQPTRIIKLEPGVNWSDTPGGH